MIDAVINQRKHIKQIYQHPHENKYWRLEDLIGHDKVRYFSFGRHALAEGLAIAGVGKGDRVLLPGFICRDLLSSINSVGAVPTYYDVGKDLKVCTATENLPDAKAIIFVNYFGFPQDLVLFREYCNRTGAILIEDNAHGLFSRDEDGKLLGTRGDIGIFSLRKTIPMPHGAALVINNSNIRNKLRPQVAFNNAGEPLYFKGKQLLRKLVPLIGVAAIQFAISIVGYFRKLITGHEIVLSSPEAEYILPANKSPSSMLFSYLSSIDIDEEICRRRELYVWVEGILKDLQCSPVFKTLPENVAPYGYPFYSSDVHIFKIKKILNKCGLMCFQWPDLPYAIKPIAREHYKNMWNVHFLW